MDNTVGSASTNFCNFFSSEKDAYILGFWCADGYSRTSSVGISNTDSDLLKKFAQFLKEYFPIDRLRLRIYYPMEVDYKIDEKILECVRKIVRYPSKKAKKVGYHLYVNSRPLLREFREAKGTLERLKKVNIVKAYFARRFDGDGSIDKNLRNDCRIVYGRENEPEIDKKILKRIGISKTNVYYYKSAKTFCLYVSRYEAKKFLKEIWPYSLKLQKLVPAPRRDLVFR